VVFRLSDKIMPQSKKPDFGVLKRRITWRFQAKWVPVRVKKTRQK